MLLFCLFYVSVNIDTLLTCCLHIFSSLSFAKLLKTIHTGNDDGFSNRFQTVVFVFFWYPTLIQRH